MKTAVEKRMMNYQTDSFGIVHHARYLEIMEEARWLYCYENNLMEPFHKKGIFHVVVNITIDYKGSVRFGEMVRIETDVFRVTEKSVVFRQVVSRDGHKLVVAEIANVFMIKPGHSVIKAGEMESFWEDLKYGRS
jgi:thioesterase-3